MATRVLSKDEVEKMGLSPKKGDGAVTKKRANVHVQEIKEQVKGTKPGQFVVYEPNDGKSYQSQVLRVRQAFDELGKPWPHTRPGEKGKFTVIRILSKKESFDRYPQQPLSPNKNKK